MKVKAFLVSSSRKEFETSQLLSKIEDEQSLGAQLQKKIKELQVTYPTYIYVMLNTCNSDSVKKKKLYYIPVNKPSIIKSRLVLRSWRKRLRLRGLLGLK